MFKFINLFCLICFWVNAGEAAELYSPKEVLSPFASPLAQTNLQSKFGVDSSSAEALKKIKRIRYEFESVGTCPLPSIPSLCTTNPSDRYYFARRKVTFSTEDLTAMVARKLQENEKDGCSDLKFSNLRRLRSDARQIVFIANVSAHKRACGDLPFGGSYSIGLSSGSGTVIISVNLGIEPSDYLNTFGNYSISATAEGQIDDSEILGFIDVDSLVGKIIGGLVDLADFAIRFQTFNLIDSGLGGLQRAIKVSDYSLSVFYDAATEAQAVKSVADFYAKFAKDNFANPSGFLDDDLTKFDQDAGSDQLIVTSKYLIAEPAMNLFYTFKDGEIRTLSSLSDAPESYIIIKNDNLWKLSKERYLFGDTYFAIAKLNALKNFRLKPGQEIVFPPLFELVAAKDTYFRPADTLWSRYLKKNGGSMGWSRKKLRLPLGSRSIDKIFAGQAADVF